VLSEFEEDLADLAGSPSGEFLVGGSSSSKNRASSLVARLDHPPGSPRLCTRRLRSSWLLHHLTVGTRLPELARAAGLVGVAVLSDLLEFVPLLSPEEAQLELRGRS